MDFQKHSMCSILSITNPRCNPVFGFSKISAPSDPFIGKTAYLIQTDRIGPRFVPTQVCLKTLSTLLSPFFSFLSSFDFPTLRYITRYIDLIIFESNSSGNMLLVVVRH